MNSRQIRFVEVATLIFFSFMCVVAVINSSFGLDNLELIRTFSSDEATLIGNVLDLDLVTKGELYYGNGYRVLPLAFLHLCKLANYHLDVQFITIALRLQSLLFGVLGALFTVLILRALKVPKLIALFGGMFLFTIPDYFHWSQMVHPDTLQTSLILLAFLIVLSEHTFRAAMLGSLMLGLACGSKFGGVLQLPFVFLPYAIAEWRKGSRRLEFGNFAPLVGRFGLFLLPFVMGFLILIPYGISHPIEFWERFHYVRADMWGINSFRPYRWLGTIATQSGVLGALLLTLGLAFYGKVLFSRFSETKMKLLDDQDFRNHLTLAATSIASLLFIMSMSRMYGELRYTYFFLPLTIIMSFCGITWLLSRVNPKVVAALFLLLILVRGFDSVKTESFASRKPIADEIRASRFVQANYPLSARFLKEWYAYVNPDYKHITRDWFLSKKMILERENETDVLVFAKGSSGRYVWMAPGTLLHDKKFVRDEKRSIDADAVQELFTWLISPESRWRLVYEGEQTLIFERKDYKDQTQRITAR